MKIYTWNINGIGKAHKWQGVLDWLYQENPDILVLQSTRARPERIAADLYQPEGYYAFWVGTDNPHIGGTGLLSRVMPESVRFEHGVATLDDEGRAVAAEFSEFTLIVCQFSVNYRDTENQVYWALDVADEIRATGKPVILGGDLRVTHNPIDTCEPDRYWAQIDWNLNDDILDAGFVDIFRSRNPNLEGSYTYWDKKSNHRDANNGHRWHRFFVSSEMEDSVVDSHIHAEERLSIEQCPVSITLSFESESPAAEPNDIPESKTNPPAVHSPRQPEEDDGSGYVYLIQDTECTKTYKIGHSVDVPTRRNTLEIMLPFEIELIHTIATPDRRTLEKVIACPLQK